MHSHKVHPKTTWYLFLMEMLCQGTIAAYEQLTVLGREISTKGSAFSPLDPRPRLALQRKNGDSHHSAYFTRSRSAPGVILLSTPGLAYRVVTQFLRFGPKDCVVLVQGLRLNGIGCRSNSIVGGLVNARMFIDAYAILPHQQRLPYYRINRCRR